MMHSDAFLRERLAVFKFIESVTTWAKDKATCEALYIICNYDNTLLLVVKNANIGGALFCSDLKLAVDMCTGDYEARVSMSEVKEMAGFYNLFR